MDQSFIRNFCIIAHIDHGKSTLADRLLEATGTVAKRDMHEQLLDSNPIERERGITIKLAPVRMIYRPSLNFDQSPSIEQIKISKIKNQRSKIQIKDQKLEKDNFEICTLNFELEDSAYTLNLIDTPGHVDFSYEVSRSLAACEGAILVVDAAQGVQAQTLANLNLARKQNLVIIPVVNKIDLPNAQIESSIESLESLGFAREENIQISAKLGTNVDKLLTEIIKRIPAPKGLPNSPLRALIFSSQYDAHKGVVAYVRIVDGSITFKGSTLQGSIKQYQKLKFMVSGAEVEPIEIGYFTPHMRSGQALLTGEVGYIATGLKDASLAKVGDTITVVSDKLSVVSDQLSVTENKNIINTKTHNSPASPAPALPRGRKRGEQLTTHNLTPLPGYKEPKPMVFLGLYPIQNEDINQVRDALTKLRLSDNAFTFRPIASVALGHGFRCGFLGLLHAEVVQERLTREFSLNLLATAPTVEYKIKVKIEDGYFTIQSAAEFPDPETIDQSFEPVMEVTIFLPKKYVGPVMQLAQTKRAEYIDLGYVGELAKFTYLIPLSEMIVDFFDALKSSTEGYASLDYEFFDYQPVELVKLDILLNHEKVDAFSQLVVATRAEYLGRRMVVKLKDVIPRQQFAIPIQAAIGGQIIARADVKPYRKDVTQKLYGGDRTRKDKLLEAQRKGKKKMKMVGRVEIPQEAFLKVFKSN